MSCCYLFYSDLKIHVPFISHLAIYILTLISCTGTLLFGTAAFSIVEFSEEFISGKKSCCSLQQNIFLERTNYHRHVYLTRRTRYVSCAGGGGSSDSSIFEDSTEEDKKHPHRQEEPQNDARGKKSLGQGRMKARAICQLS